MKTQMTMLAAAVALSVSSLSFAQTTPDARFQGASDTIDTMDGYAAGSPPGSDSFIDQSQGSYNNSTDVKQWGSQYSRITQQGSNNEIIVSQDDVVGTAMVEAGYNESIIEQGGNNNLAKVNQVGQYNDSWISQEGTGSASTVTQTGAH